MNRRAVVVVIAVVVSIGGAAAPRVARADLVMPPVSLEHQAGVAIDYLGASGIDGVSVMADYRRPLSSRIAVTADAGVQGASRAAEGGWSLANLTVGGIYVVRASALRVTATVPLASDDGDAAVAAALHGSLRVADGERFAVRTGALRVAAARRVDRAKAFAQVELAAVALIRGGGASDELQLRLGLAGGVRVVRRVSLLGELTTVSGILSGGLDRLAPDEPAEDFRHTLDLGLRADLPRLTLTVRLEVPLDHSLRSRDAYLAGLSASLPL